LHCLVCYGYICLHFRTEVALIYLVSPLGLNTKNPDIPHDGTFGHIPVDVVRPSISLPLSHRMVLYESVRISLVKSTCRIPEITP
jgi:hypothetical protein